MNYHQAISYRGALTDFVDFKSRQNPCAMSLTFKQCIWPQPSARQMLTPIDAAKNTKHFQNLLNGHLLTRVGRRNGLRIGAVIVLENDEDTRLHCHGMIECPDKNKLEQLPYFIAKTWPNTIWGYDQTVTEPCTEDWLEYLLKFRTKTDYGTAMQFDLWSAPLSKQN